MNALQPKIIEMIGKDKWTPHMTLEEAEGRAIYTITLNATTNIEFNAHNDKEAVAFSKIYNGHLNHNKIVGNKLMPVILNK